MNITAEMATTPTAAANLFGVEVATAWRNFSDVLSSTPVIDPDAFLDARACLVIAASHLEALGLDASEIDDQIDALESVAATLDHVEIAISDVLTREPADWPKAWFRAGVPHVTTRPTHPKSSPPCRCARSLLATPGCSHGGQTRISQR